MGVRRSRRLAELAAKKCKKVVACDSSKVVRSSCAQTEFGHVSFSAHGGDYKLGDIPISAANDMDAWRMLNDEWHLDQLKYLEIAERENSWLLKEEFFAWQSGGIIELKHPLYKPTFHGRCWKERGWLIYIEDNSFIRVAVRDRNDFESALYLLVKEQHSMECSLGRAQVDAGREIWK